MFVYFNGLALGFSLIMALGPQNVFLIRQGVARSHAILSATICFICDLVLVSASVTGLREVLTLYPSFQQWMMGFGVLFLLYYGSQAITKSFFKKTTQSGQAKELPSRFKIVLLALGFSLLNPHAIIDSLVIIGSGSSQFPEHEYAFLMGVITSSLLWFTSLTFTTRYFASSLGRAAIWRRIELGSGLLMIALSIKLACTMLNI